MARRRDSVRSIGNRYAPPCETCGAERPRDQLGRPVWKGKQFVHCEGTTVGWLMGKKDNPHHGHVRYPDCWKCHRSLGCDECCGIVTEVLCRKCAVWGTIDAFVHHGPIVNHPAQVAKRGGIIAPQVADYPPKFQRAYQETEAI